MGTLDGQVALITGAGSGMGAAFARRLAVDGVHVVVNDLAPDAAAEIAAEVGGTAAPFDVGDSVAFDEAVDKTVATHGRIDIVVNNAGIAPPLDADRTQRAIANQMLRMEGRVSELVPTDITVGLSDAEFDRMIRTHLYGTFHGVRAALRHMTPARRGSVINISSVLGVRPSPGAPHYSAAKAAIIALTKSSGGEVAPFGVRVNAICPGWIDTPLLAPFDPVMRAGIVMQIPSGRMGLASELAEMVRFLAGPESSYSFGDVFSASGGFV